MKDQFWQAVVVLLDPSTWTGAAIYAVALFVVAWLSGRALQLTVHRVIARRGGSLDGLVDIAADGIQDGRQPPQPFEHG